eukprot:3421821-Amphidinium_carterae.1
MPTGMTLVVHALLESRDQSAAPNASALAPRYGQGSTIEALQQHITDPVPMGCPQAYVGDPKNLFHV